MNTQNMLLKAFNLSIKKIEEINCLNFNQAVSIFLNYVINQGEINKVKLNMVNLYNDETYYHKLKTYIELKIAYNQDMLKLKQYAKSNTSNIANITGYIHQYNRRHQSFSINKNFAIAFNVAKQSGLKQRLALYRKAIELM